jgi:hypothetical protein
VQATARPPDETGPPQLLVVKVAGRAWNAKLCSRFVLIIDQAAAMRKRSQPRPRDRNDGAGGEDF